MKNFLRLILLILTVGLLSKLAKRGSLCDGSNPCNLPTSATFNAPQTSQIGELAPGTNGNVNGSVYFVAASTTDFGGTVTQCGVVPIRVTAVLFKEPPNHKIAESYWAVSRFIFGNHVIMCCMFKRAPQV